MSQTIINSTTIDDTSPLITYAGASWTVHQNVEGIFHLYNNTDTFTDVQGATATLRFYGNAIEYWGNRGPYHGNCLVTIDGQDLATANSHATLDDTPILLFSTNQLELKDHELVIKVLDPAYPAVCEIDRFVVNVTSNPTTTGLYTGTGIYPTASVASGNTGGGNTSSSSSSPPIAAIAGGVGGAAVLCLLLIGFWLYKRSKKNKKDKAGIITGSKLSKASATKPLLSDGPLSPAPATEKNGFRIPQTYPNQPSSYVSSSPPASSYNPSSPTPSANPHLVAMANSPQQPLRPMSIVSSTSAAPTSYYTSGVPTSEGGFQGYYPQPLPPQQQQQHQQLQPQQYQQQQQQQYQQQPVGVAPVWAHPNPTSSPPPTHIQHPSGPSPSQSPAPVVASRPSPSASPAPTAATATSFPAEKAQYMPRPEKSGFSGTQAGQSTAGASSSSAPAPTGASGSGPTAHSEDILTTPVPDLPPPAYQF